MQYLQGTGCVLTINSLAANLLIQSRQPQLFSIALRACVLLRFARSPARFSFAALASGLFYGIEKTAVAQRLGLVEGQPDVRDGFVAQNLVKERAVGSLAAGVICAGFFIRVWSLFPRLLATGFTSVFGL